MQTDSVVHDNSVSPHNTCHLSKRKNRNLAAMHADVLYTAFQFDGDSLVVCAQNNQ